MEWNGNKKTVKIFVVRTIENLLGRPALEALNRIKWPETQVSEVNSAKELYTNKQVRKLVPSVFEGLRQLKKFECSIKLNKNTEPVAMHTPRREPLLLLEAVRKELNEMIQRGIITEVNKVTEWCSPMVVVRKQKGIRICTDFTELNKYVIRERYLLATVEETIASLRNANHFLKLDCTKGFWQLKLNEKSQKYTTFITPFGRFMYYLSV